MVKESSSGIGNPYQSMSFWDSKINSYVNVSFEVMPAVRVQGLNQRSALQVVEQ